MDNLTSVTAVLAKDVKLGDDEQVKMVIDFGNDDVVSFAKNAKMRKKTKIVGTTVTVDFFFKDGNQLSHSLALPKGLEVSDLSTCYLETVANGLSQKIGDKANQSKSVKDAFLAVRDGIKQVYDPENGVWNASRTGGNSQPTIVMEAFRRWISAQKGEEVTLEYTDAWMQGNASIVEQLKDYTEITAYEAEIKVERAEARRLKALKETTPTKLSDELKASLADTFKVVANS